jgi:2-dehydro-3-deoxygluconokinase
MNLDMVTMGETMVAFQAAAADFGPLRTVTRFDRWVVGAESNVSIGLACLGFTTGCFSHLGNDFRNINLSEVMHAIC